MTLNIKFNIPESGKEVSNCKEAISLNQSHHIPVIIGGMFIDNFIFLFHLRLNFGFTEFIVGKQC